MTKANFKVERETQTIVKFTFYKEFDGDDFKKFIGVMTKLLDQAVEKNRPYGFYIDAREAHIAKPNTARKLIHWLRTNKHRIPGILLASSVAITNKFIIKLINGAFKIAPPVSPNKITSDLEVGRNFVHKIVNDHYAMKLIVCKSLKK